MFKLYDYFRSSACYRVRIALNLKALDYEQIPIHLTKEGGHQFQDSYKNVNPQQLVPALLLIDTNQILTQSLSIMEYLEETFPDIPLLPNDVVARANVRAFAQVIACDIHPINNLRVLKYLKHHFHVSDEQKMAWYFHWLTSGFDTLEKILEKQPSGPFCFGQIPTLADVCLIPQVYNALRFDYSLEGYPHIQQVYEHANKHPAFIKALPENQPDAE